MANAAGLIHESIWRDDDWRQLSRGAQALYMQLLSQKEVDCAGVLPLQPHKWAKGCDGLTAEQVMADLDELQQHRFVYYDEDTDEALIRSYIRRAPNVMKVPNMRKSARRAAALVGSSKLRAVLADEMRATGDPDFIVSAEELHPSSTSEPAASKQISEPLRKGSVTLTEPSSVSESVSESHLSSTKGGSTRPICSKHPNGNSEGNCRGCMKTREWDEQHAEALAADELEQKRRRRALVASCPDCNGTNVIEVAENRVIKCQHQAVLHG
jgi:hypothetical protein